MDIGEKASNGFDFTDAKRQRALLLGIDQEGGQMNPQGVLQALQ